MNVLYKAFARTGIRSYCGSLAREVLTMRNWVKCVLDWCLYIAVMALLPSIVILLWFAGYFT